MGEFRPIQALKEYLPKVLSSPQTNMQRTMDLFDQYEAEQTQIRFQEASKIDETPLEIPPSLQHVLTPDMHTYIAIELPQALETGVPKPWLTLVESFGMRAAAFESTHGQSEQALIVNEDNITKEINLAKESSYASYTDAKLRIDASWTQPYEGEDWTLSGFAQCEIASLKIMDHGVIETRVALQGTEDRSQHSICITQQNLNNPASLSYRFSGTYDRDGNPVPGR